MRTSPVGCTKSKARSAHRFPICDRDCLCQCNMRGFPCPFKEAEGTRVQAPASCLPVSQSLWSQDGNWRTFQRTFSPGTGAVAIKPIVTHLQRGSCRYDSTLQSTCTSWQCCWQTCKLCLLRALFPASFLCCISLLKATSDLQQHSLASVT